MTYELIPKTSVKRRSKNILGSTSAFRDILPKLKRVCEPRFMAASGNIVQVGKLRRVE